MGDIDIFTRQLDLIRPSELDFPIEIIGAGGIGSWATLALAKMGCRNITVYDYDKVEEKNIPAQIYSFSDVGKYKVTALTNLIKQLTGTEIATISSKFQDTSPSEHKVVICAVDSLEERREIWSNLTRDKKLNFEVYLDVRMAGELIRILTVSPYSPYSIQKYISSIDPLIPAYEEPCTSRSVIYNTFMCGGLIANIVKKYAKKEDAKVNLTFDITNLTIL